MSLCGHLVADKKQTARMSKMLWTVWLFTKRLLSPSSLDDSLLTPIATGKALPLDDAPRPTVDFCVLLVYANSSDSLAQAVENLRLLGVEYLHGRCAVALVQDTPEPNSSGGHESSEGGVGDRSGIGLVPVAMATDHAMRGVACEAIAFATKWHLPLVHGSAASEGGLADLAASVLRVAKGAFSATPLLLFAAC